MTPTEQYSNELYHYGVLGMKWGVRRGNTEKAYSKASRKLDKLDSRVEKRETKMNKKIRKADENLTKPWLFSGGSTKQNRLNVDAQKAVVKYKKDVRKAKTWLDSMKKSFDGTNVTFTKEQIDRGKKYASVLITDSLIRYS